MTVSSTPRFQEKREAILDGAARLFNSNGIKGGTLADVARSVGLITNSITYYYRKKEDLVCACLLRSIEAVERLLSQAERETTVEARVRAFISAYVAMLADIALGRHPEVLSFSDTRALTAPHDKAVFAAYTEMFRHLRRLLKHGTEGADRLDLNARAHLLLSVTTWTRVWIGRYELADYERVGRWMGEIMVRGVAAPDSAWRDFGEAMERPASAAASVATPEAYLRAASRLVNEHGYRGASVDRISAELKLTKGSFYHHHETKEDLIAACFERTFSVVRQVQMSASQHPGHGWDRLVLAVRSLVRFQMSHEGPLLRVSAWSSLPENMRAQQLRTMNALSERFAGFIVDGMQDGSMRVVDQTVAAQLVNGTINAAAELGRWAPGITADIAADVYARPMMKGLLDHSEVQAAALHET